jgi:hypothetical protein
MEIPLHYEYKYPHPSYQHIYLCVVSSCSASLWALHGTTLGSYLRDDLNEGGAGGVACLRSLKP